MDSKSLSQNPPSFIPEVMRRRRRLGKILRKIDIEENGMIKIKPGKV